MDFERVKLLLDVILACGAHGPQFQAIAAEARKELLDMNEVTASANRKPPVPQPVPAPTPVTEAPRPRATPSTGDAPATTPTASVERRA